MKFAVIVLLAFVAAIHAAPTQVSDNNVGDIVTVGINAKLDIDSKIDQDIFSVILGLKNYQRITADLPDINLPTPTSNFKITPEMIEKFKGLMAQ
ncbi:CLUMA_CG017272, isoform A [Clunio marinus]|uniref:CLUMA_CG017272, isoform A n=1 Tax=Clunio marinus TaxID=568069 RepID=A0A1J1IZZ1_9DIPT|nr:CLUMA_CG017272, isoform A [Clunio marinus]